MKRRQFIYQASLGTGTLLLPTTEIKFSDGLFDIALDHLTFGIVADVHHGMIPDTEERLEKFIREAIRRKVDFIIQLGDFCHAENKSDHFVKIWNQFDGPKYHVLGNHDMDLNSKADAITYWEMPSNYYTFDFADVRFIVLDANFLYQDGNFVDYDRSNFYVDSRFRTYINAEQVEWLAAELKESELPVIVFSHQSLWHYQHGVRNRLEIQKHLEHYGDKIICCMNGHDHIDYHHHQNGVDYIEINSMSYQWVGDSYPANRYPPEVASQYKWLSHIAPYQDPLYAFASIESGKILEIEGVRSKWMPPSPYELGMPLEPIGNVSTPVISDYKLKKE